VTLFTLAIFVAGIWLLSFYADRMLREDIAHQLGRQQPLHHCWLLKLMAS